MIDDGGEELDQARSTSSRSENAAKGQSGAATTQKQPNKMASVKSPTSCLSDGDPGKESFRKENMGDMKSKLQSIQTGKAYLEKKIQEYEARLSQMKIKKDKTAKWRGS